MKRVFRIIITFLLKYSWSEKFSDILLWPVSKRLFKNYTERVEIDKGLFMNVYGDMPDMVNKTLLFKREFLAWEKETAKIVKTLNAKNIVVAGAHIGYYPLILSQDKEAKIYAFEPNPFNFERLIKNFPSAYNFALGEKEETKEMFFDAGQSSLVDKRGDKKGNVKIITLDSFIKENKVDLMILDAEGYELNILKGAVSTIEKYHPDIIFEEKNEIEHGIRDFLKERGYRFSEIVDHYSFRNIFATTKK